MRLSVLDQSTASKGRAQDTAIRETLELARHCDALGYHRYWVSEHHNSGSIVGTAPEILMSAIAATTPRIRVGSAGVMLPHYSALKVAEQFRVLEAIAPGRIDLGIGRAPGSDQMTSYALNPNPQNVLDQFPRQVQELRHWVSGTPLPERHPFSRVIAQPTGPSSPELWILGSSDYGAQLAAHFGLPYAFAYFFSEGTGVEQALDFYRKDYRPSEMNPKPIATICVWALAAIPKKKRCTNSKPANAPSSIADKVSVCRSCRPKKPSAHILPRSWRLSRSSAARRLSALQTRWPRG